MYIPQSLASWRLGAAHLFNTERAQELVVTQLSIFAQFCGAAKDARRLCFANVTPHSSFCNPKMRETRFFFDLAAAAASWYTSTIHIKNITGARLRPVPALFTGATYLDAERCHIKRVVCIFSSKMCCLSDHMVCASVFSRLLWKSLGSQQFVGHRRSITKNVLEKKPKVWSRPLYSTDVWRLQHYNRRGMYPITRCRATSLRCS